MLREPCFVMKGRACTRFGCEMHRYLRGMFSPTHGVLKYDGATFVVIFGDAPCLRDDLTGESFGRFLRLARKTWQGNEDRLVP